ncbi:MAG: TadE family protein, partial [Thermoanaerobaculia bacterium]
EYVRAVRTGVARRIGVFRTGSSRSGSRAQGLVEFALVIPIFLVMLMAIFDFGRVIYAYHTITQDAQEAERNGVVSPVFSQAKYNDIRSAGLRNSPGTSLNGSLITGEPGKSCTAAGGTANDTTSTTTCFYPDGVTSGKRVVINIAVTVPIITPIMSNLVGGSFQVTATSIGYLP